MIISLPNLIYQCVRWLFTVCEKEKILWFEEHIEMFTVQNSPRPKQPRSPLIVRASAGTAYASTTVLRLVQLFRMTKQTSCCDSDRTKLGLQRTWKRRFIISNFIHRIDFLIWLWLKDPSNPYESEFVVYRFRVVPFGAKSSPFILNSIVIRHLQKDFSSITANVQRNIFVDNIISGCDSREKALVYYNQANEIMERTGLPLQAWGFSDATIEDELKTCGRLDKCEISKTLGFLWNRIDDSLSIQKVNLLTFCFEVATPRDVLRGPRQHSISEG